MKFSRLSHLGIYSYSQKKPILQEIIISSNILPFDCIEWDKLDLKTCNSESLTVTKVIFRNLDHFHTIPYNSS